MPKTEWMVHDSEDGVEFFDNFEDALKSYNAFKESQYEEAHSYCFGGGERVVLARVVRDYHAEHVDPPEGKDPREKYMDFVEDVYE